MKATRWLWAVALCLTGCGGAQSSAEDTQEVGHAAADVMASFDETSTGGGFAFSSPLDRPGLGKTTLDRALDLVVSPAYAEACWLATFSSCSAGTRTRSFDHCALAGFSLDGSVTLTFSQSTCSAAAVGDTVTRNADFTLHGRANYSLAVDSKGGGQKVTRTADGFTYQVLGMERVLTNASGKKIIDISTKTEEDLVVQGFTRANRVIKSGKFDVVHNLAGYTVQLVPADVTWNGTCNCPVSGKLTGSITAGKNVGKSAEVVFNGCGKGTVTVGTDTEDVDFDRCAAL
jgi:hypothetical protein